MIRLQPSRQPPDFVIGAQGMGLMRWPGNAYWGAMSELRDEVARCPGLRSAGDRSLHATAAGGCVDDRAADEDVVGFRDE